MTRTGRPWLSRSSFFQAEAGIRDDLVTGVQTCALPIFSAKLVRKRKSWRQEGGVENGDCWSQAPREVKMKAILDIDVFILGVFWKCPPFKLLELHSEMVERVSFSKPICGDPDDAMTISSRHSLRTPITS